ncbi:MAG: hypothetical protein J6M22_01975 [Firmicutes bacterium]|nr:hypothetical protein [Bacillota bacterium]
MTKKELFDLIIEKFTDLPEVKAILDEKVEIKAKSLTPEEAIGNTERKDYPILTGKDVMIEATYNGVSGQAFTSAPADFSGTLADIMKLDYENDDHAAGLLIAAINAVMGSLGLCDRMIHCKNEGPKLCGREIGKYVKENYEDPKVLVVGYQPSIIENLTSQGTKTRALDLDPNNVGQERCGIIIEHGVDDMADAIEWADMILCTGSTVCNGTLVDYMDLGKPTYFFGTSLAGTAELLGLKRLCFPDLQ